MRLGIIRYACVATLTFVLSISMAANASASLKPVHLKFNAFKSHSAKKAYYFAPKTPLPNFEKNPLFNDGLSSYTANQTAYEAEAYQSLSNPGSLANQHYNFRVPSNNLSLNSSQLGWHGAIDLSATYDDTLGMIYRGQYTRYLFNHNNAFSIIADYGPKELRGNFTFAHQFNARNRIKVTYEYLKQKLPFDFASVTVNKWIGQNAYGVDYEYLVGKGILHSVELTGSYVKAHSMDLPSLPVDVDGTWYDDFRHIAGGTEENASVKANLYINKHWELSPSVGYSSLKYNAIYSSQPSTHELSYGLQTTAIFNPRLEATASIQHDASSNQYSGGVNYIVGHHVAIGLGDNYIAGGQGLPSQNEVTFQLSFNAPSKYTLSENDSLSPLLSWVKTPAVYMSQVLAIKDEKLVAFALNAAAMIPSQNVEVGKLILPVDTSKYFTHGSHLSSIQYDVTIAQLGGVKSAAEQNFINSLYIEYSKINPYAILIKSYKPIPEKFLHDKFKVTVSAIGMQGGRKVTNAVSSSFNLNVIGNSTILPHWVTFKLPIATVGIPYTYSVKKYVSITEDGGSLTFNKLSNGESKWLSMNAQSGELSGTPAPQNVGTKTVVMRVKDTASNKWVNKSIALQVTKNQKLAPVWATTPNELTFIVGPQGTPISLNSEKYIQNFSAALKPLVLNWMLLLMG